MKTGVKLILDVQATQSRGHGERGIARYAQSLSVGLLKRTGRVAGMLVNPQLPFPENLRSELKDSGLALPNTKPVRDRLVREADGRVLYLVLSPFEFPNQEPIIPLDFLERNVPFGFILYDLIPYLHPEQYFNDPVARNQYLQRLRLFKRADCLFTISESARRDALRCLKLSPERVISIGTGVNSFFCEEPESPAQIQNTKVNALLSRNAGKYILSVLGEDPRKNLQGLLTAYKLIPPALRANHPLVIAGKYKPHSIVAALKEAGMDDATASAVIFPGVVTDEELRELYRQAAVFVFPSFYEGFGLPVAEAAACGCPVLVSNTSSLPEIVNWPGATFSPSEPMEIADRILRALEDPSFRDKLRKLSMKAAVRHRWPQVLDRLHRALCAREQGRLPMPRADSPRLRLAIIGPVTPVRSGIADYNTKVIMDLERMCEVDVFVPDEVSLSFPSPFRRARRFLLESFARTHVPSMYNQVVYTLGNSEYHVTSLRLFRRYPGVVWLHDACLSGLYYMDAHPKFGPNRVADFLPEWVAAWYPEWKPPVTEVAGEFYNDAKKWASIAPRMTREVIQGATAVLVHSERAEALVREDQPEGTAFPPVCRLPLAVAPKEGIPPLREKPQWLGVFGLMGPAKDPVGLMRIFMKCRERFPELKLVFAGQMDPDCEPDLFSLADEAGLSEEDYLITGYLNQEDYTSWLGKVDLAVYRRVADNGESSAAANDCLASGIPVISNIPSLLDLPEQAICRIPFDSEDSVWVEKITELLADPSLRLRYREAGLDYVSTISFRQVSRDLLDWLLQLST